jgi:8-oxo-dGTP pyrophosphatase MutT (NUDIX family)
MKGKLVFTTPFFTIEELPAADTLNGLPYYRLNGPDSVICCVMNLKSQLLMVKQYRPNLNIHTLEFPAGEIDSGETPREAATREIREELGIGCKMISLGHYLLMMNRTNIKNHLFFCLSSSEEVGVETEKGIEKITISREEFKALNRDSEYFQLAGLGILQLASLVLNINVLNDPFDEVVKAFNIYVENN